MTKLSVIIPFYDAADTIAIQLEALARQKWSQPWEIIIAENASADKSLAIFDYCRTKLPHFRLVNASKRPGASYARNVGAMAAKGEALAFCDADDEVADGWVVAMGEALSKYDFVAGSLNPNKFNDPQILKVRNCPQQNGLQIYKYPPYLPHAAAANFGVKRSIHQAIGGFDENLYRLQDTDYCWRVQLTGTELQFIPDAVVYYRFRGTLAGNYQQAYGWGKYNVLLNSKYCPLGMPELTWKNGIRRWAKLLRRLPKIIHHPDEHARWIWQLFWRLGRLRGCIKYRVMAA